MIPIKESPLASQFAACLKRMDAQMHESVFWAARLASLAVDSGQVCIDLKDFAGREVSEAVSLPNLSDWKAFLRQSLVVGKPFEFKPLILEGDLLYLARYWHYERVLADGLMLRAKESAEIDAQRLSLDLQRLFADNRQIPDLQKAAAAIAVLRRFCVISGGPGTGKTSTVVRILALLLAQSRLRICLAAPTGKAAARMSESIRAQKSNLDFPKELVELIPEDATTLHRLLGSRPNSAYFRHGKDNPLVLDVLVVDEASMIDLALMAKLLEALPSHARLILLGDKDQLSAVEAGSVFGDICAGQGYSDSFRQRIEQVSGVELALNQTGPLADSIAFLTHSHRFSDKSGIGELAKAINQGKAEAAAALLAEGLFSDIAWQRESFANDFLLERIEKGYAAYFEGVEAGLPPGQLFGLFDLFRVLTAYREGPAGAVTLNQMLEDRQRARFQMEPHETWYPGRPVIITRNDYGLKLFNGDIGLCLMVEDRLKVCFEDAEGRIRHFAPSRIPDHSCVYAMTTHKSQGSEFEQVLFLLPEVQSPVLNRPLIYTAITRAKRRLELWGRADVLKASIAKTAEQSSGLYKRLWGDGSSK